MFRLRWRSSRQLASNEAGCKNLAGRQGTLASKKLKSVAVHLALVTGDRPRLR